MGHIHFRILLVIPLLIAPPAQASWFIRGDPDGSGRRNIADVILLIGHLFHADSPPLGCLAAADVNDDGKIDVTDAIDLLQYLFLGTPPPWPEPLFPRCIREETNFGLGCEESEACSPRGVVYVVDRSGSMSEAANFGKLQRVVVQEIVRLSPSDQFAIIFFDVNVTWFPSSKVLVDATEQVRGEGLAFVLSAQTGHGTCPRPALLSALDLAEKSTARFKEIVFITDGDTLCPGITDGVTYQNETLAEVTARNTAGVAIDVIGVGSSVNDGWLRELAAQNGGSYSVIP
jgi:VWA domain-containing protein/dockerin type I repeat protein